MTTSESFRKEVAEKIDHVLKSADPRASVSFASCLSAEDRKYVHHVAEQFGLQHESKGKGDARHIIVMKDPNKLQRRNLAPGENAVPQLRLPEEAWNILEHPLVEHAARPGNIERLASSAPMAAMSAEEVTQLLQGDSSKRTQSVVNSFEKGPPDTPLLNTRRGLPAWGVRPAVLQAVHDHQVVLVVGATGSGKSTQIPQFIIEEFASANVVVTQPRRLSALALAHRVAQERGEACGKSVGYSVHLENESSAATRLLFCTTGILRRRLLANPQLSDITHLVLDELHEREKIADFILIALRDLLKVRPDLRLVLMSATMQHETFRRYFPESTQVDVEGRMFPVEEKYLDDIVPTLHEKGYWKSLGPGFAAGGLGFGSWTDKGTEKSFKYQVLVSHAHERDGLCGFSGNARLPMKGKRFQEGLFLHDVLQQTKGVQFDIPIVEALLLYVAASGDTTGGILVFLPGWDDIDRLRRRLRENSTLGDQQRFIILALHSHVRLEQQKEVFKRPAGGMRKIVLSTNIAETSLTIDDIEVVVDCGRVKETSYDPFIGVPTLNTSWISQASMRQRAGRAGRTSPGICYHLFARQRADAMDAHRPPELLRAPLEDVYLHSKLLLLRQGNLDLLVEDFLKQAPDPPDERSLKNAETLLREIGAIVGNDSNPGQLTALGAHLSSLPLSPQFAKVILWSNFLGVGSDALMVIASVQYREPFVSMNDASKAMSLAQMNQAVRQAKAALSSPHCSDHIALMQACAGFEKAMAAGGDVADAFCKQHCLATKQMHSVQQTCSRLRRELKSRGFWSEHGSRNAGNVALLSAALCAGLFPNLACRPNGKRLKMLVSNGRLEALPHSSSVASATNKGEDLWKHWNDMSARHVDDEGNKAEANNASWLCFNELSQVEDHYSLSGLTLVPILAILLLCGEGDLVLHDVDGVVAEEGRNSAENVCLASSSAFDAWWGDASSETPASSSSQKRQCRKDEVVVSVYELGDWLNVRVSRTTAARLQALRAMVRFLFKVFCNQPDRWNKVIAPGQVGAHILGLVSELIEAESGSKSKRDDHSASQRVQSQHGTNGKVSGANLGQVDSKSFSSSSTSKGPTLESKNKIPNNAASQQAEGNPKGQSRGAVRIMTKTDKGWRSETAGLSLDQSSPLLTNAHEVSRKGRNGPRKTMDGDAPPPPPPPPPPPALAQSKNERRTDKLEANGSHSFYGNGSRREDALVSNVVLPATSAKRAHKGNLATNGTTLTTPSWTSQSYYVSEQRVCGYCGQLFAQHYGDWDENDGAWYCLCCWDSYVSAS